MESENNAEAPESDLRDDDDSRDGFRISHQTDGSLTVSELVAIVLGPIGGVLAMACLAYKVTLHSS